MKKPVGRKRKAVVKEDLSDIEAETAEDSPKPSAKRSRPTSAVAAISNGVETRLKRGRKPKQRPVQESEEEAILPQYKGATATDDKPTKKSMKAKQAQEEAEDENNEAEEEPEDPKVGKKSRIKQTDKNGESEQEQKPAKRGRKPKQQSKDDAEKVIEHKVTTVQKRGRKLKT